MIMGNFAKMHKSVRGGIGNKWSYKELISSGAGSRGRAWRYTGSCVPCSPASTSRDWNCYTSAPGMHEEISKALWTGQMLKSWASTSALPKARAFSSMLSGCGMYVILSSGRLLWFLQTYWEILVSQVLTLSLTLQPRLALDSFYSPDWSGMNNNPPIFKLPSGIYGRNIPLQSTKCCDA